MRGKSASHFPDFLKQSSEQSLNSEEFGRIGISRNCFCFKAGEMNGEKKREDFFVDNFRRKDIEDEVLF